MSVDFFVEAPARIEARVVNRFRDRAAGGQPVPNLRRTMSCGVFLRCDACGRLEYAMKITRAAADYLRQLLERRFLFALFDHPADFRDKGRVFGGQAFGIAALAGPEAGGPRVLEVVVQLHVLRVGHTRRARWAAVNARGHDRVPKIAVRRLVAGDDPRPTRVLRYRWRRRFLKFRKRYGHGIASFTLQ